EGLGCVAPRARRGHEVVALRPHLEDVGPHRLRAPGDLPRGLALRAERHEEARDLRRRRLTGHDLAHDGAGLRAAQVAAVEQGLEGALDHARRKLRAIAGPSGVSTDSGWNWTPSIGS